LGRYETGVEGFLPQMFKGDENWVHNFEPVLTRQLTKRQPNDISSKKKFNSAPSVGKNVAAIFWNEKCVIFVHFLLRGDYSEL
jgi:hypothetical protein